MPDLLDSVYRYAGVEVFATVSSNGKKDLLINHIGVLENHIFSNRRSGFKEGILQVRRGNGVYIALNSHSGNFIRKSLS